jgi:hypothetical protein
MHSAGTGVICRVHRGDERTMQSTAGALFRAWMPKKGGFWKVWSKTRQHMPESSQLLCAMGEAVHTGGSGAASGGWRQQCRVRHGCRHLWLCTISTASSCRSNGCVTSQVKRHWRTRTAAQW